MAGRVPGRNQDFEHMLLLAACRSDYTGQLLGERPIEQLDETLKGQPAYENLWIRRAATAARPGSLCPNGVGDYDVPPVSATSGGQGEPVPVERRFDATLRGTRHVSLGLFGGSKKTWGG